MPIGKRKRSDFNEGDGRPCALNDWLKFIFAIVNLLYCCFGIALLGLAATNSDSWGAMDGGSFSRIMNYMYILGSLIVVFVVVGCLGMVHQTVREGNCRGRRLLCCFEVGVIALLYMQFIMVIFTMNAVGGLQEVITAFKKGESEVSYLEIEDSMSKNFNAYYFSTYDGSQSDTFWKWLNGNCPSEMVATDCNAESYASTCPVEATCDADGPDDSSCPYEMCRQPAAEALLYYMGPLADYGLFLLCFEIVVIILTCLLICFNPHDDEKDLLTKAVGFDADAEDDDEHEDLEAGLKEKKKKKKKKKKTKHKTGKEKSNVKAMDF